MSPCLSNVYMDAVMKEVKLRMERMEVRFLKEGREWRFPGLLYADDLVLCGESSEELKLMVGRFFQVCRRRGLKVNADKSKVMVLVGVDGVKLEQVSKFKYYVCVLDESGTDYPECCRMVASMSERRLILL